MEKILTDGAHSLGIGLDESALGKLTVYARMLKEWNTKINLTAITDDEGIARKHFLDSLTLLAHGGMHGKVIDVGTGAGFPGLVLKIARPETDITLLDSLNKRLVFLKAVCDELGLDDVKLIHMRAEDGARRSELREGFDIVTARAVANMEMLSELCLPYVKVGGVFLAMKGPAAEAELEEAKRAITILGGEVGGVTDIDASVTDGVRRIIEVKKVRHTPVKFPRSPAHITKSPVESCYKINKKHTK